MKVGPKIIWVILPLVFLALAALRIGTPDHKTVFAPGDSIASGFVGNAHTLVGVHGTVTRVRKKSTGITVITLQADDGGTVILTVGPTVGATIPKVGTRIEAVGSQTDTGMLAILKRDDISELDPRYDLGPVAYKDPLDAKPGDRFKSSGRFRVLKTYRNGNKRAELRNPDGSYVGQALIPAEVAKDLYDGHIGYQAYKRSDGTFKIERLVEIL